MKKFLTITFIALLILLGMAINVQAASTLDELKAELAAESETVTLTETVTVTGTETIDLNNKTLVLTKTLVVDGGNLTITGNGTMTTEVVDPLIDVKKGSTLTVENATLESTTYYGAAVQVTGSATDEDIATKVTIGENVSVTANYPVYITKGGAFDVVIDVYGDLKSITTENTQTGEIKYGAALYINGGIAATTGDVPVINVYETASVVAQDSSAVYAAGYGIWNIKGGYFEGTDALSIKGGVFNITGGTFKATGEFNPNPDPNNNGSEDTGCAISVTGNDKYAGKVQLNISNATVTSENGYAVYEKTTSAVQPAVESILITSGNFSGEEGDVQVEEQKNFIEGGTFASGVEEEYLSTKVDSVVGEDGKVVVKVKHDIIINKTVNGTVTSSVSQAIQGETVKLTVTPAEGYKLKGDLKVITSADSAVTVTDNSFVMPDLGVIVIAEFEKIETTSSTEGNTEVEEKDDTPKTGTINVPSYVWIALASIALVGIATTKKPSKHSK